MNTEIIERDLDLDGLAGQLVAAAKTRGVDLTGPGGLLTGLTKQVLETALESELTEHLGHDRHERSTAGWVSSGSLARPVVTNVGPGGAQFSVAMVSALPSSTW